MFKDMTVEEMLAKFDVKLGEAFWAHLEYESIGVSQDYAVKVEKDGFYILLEGKWEKSLSTHFYMSLINKITIDELKNVLYWTVGEKYNSETRNYEWAVSCEQWKGVPKDYMAKHFGIVYKTKEEAEKEFLQKYKELTGEEWAA